MRDTQGGTAEDRSVPLIGQLSNRYFGHRWRQVQELLDQQGRDPADFATGLATM